MTLTKVCNENTGRLDAPIATNIGAGETPDLSKENLDKRWHAIYLLLEEAAARAAPTETSTTGTLAKAQIDQLHTKP